MKFYDNAGNMHETYIGTIGSNIKNILAIGASKMDKFIKKKLTGCKEAEEISMNDDWRNYDPDIDNDDIDNIINDDIDDPLSPNNIVSVTPIDRDEIFVPGTTPKIKCNKSHTVKIDYNNHQIMLLDKNNNIIHSTIIDPRLENMSIKDLINILYEIEE